MKLEQLKKMIREIAKKEMLKEEEINWNAVENAIINFLKTNTKILDKKVQSKDTEGVKNGLKSILSGLTNAQRSLKLESTSRTAMEIGGLTGLNKDVVQKFVDTHKLDIEKVFQFVKKGKLSDRMDFVTAVSGKPNNPIQKKLIKKLQESVNEDIKAFDERSFGKNGIIIMIDDNGKKVSAIFKNRKNADKYNRNNSEDLKTLVSLANKKGFGKAIDESVNEATLINLQNINGAQEIAAKTKLSYEDSWNAITSYLVATMGLPKALALVLKLEKEYLKMVSESVTEGKDFKKVKKDKYGNHLEPQFKKGDKVTYLGNKGVITNVNKEMGGTYSYDVSYSKGNGKTKASNIFNKDGKTIQLESVNEATNSAKMMAGIKKGSQTGPWTIVVSFNKKVYYQTQVKTKNEIPAKFEHMKKVTNIFGNKPDYIITIEDSTGMTVYSEKLLNEAKKYDIGSGYLDNGLTIWNRAEEKDGDYETIAHIGKDGKLTIYDKEIPADIKKMFGIWATSMKKGNRPGSY